MKRKDLATRLGVDELCTITREELANDLDAILAKVEAGYSPILIIADGKPDLLLFSWEDYKRRFSLVYSPEEFERLEKKFRQHMDKGGEKMPFEAMKEMAKGVPDYLEVRVAEDGLLEKATDVIHALGYDMEEAIAVFLRRVIQSPHDHVDPSRAEDFISQIADTTLDDMVTQPLLIPKHDVFTVELVDYATPGFSSQWKPYFGTIEDIAEFRRALHKDEDHAPDDMEFSTVKVYGSKHESHDAGKYAYTNIWGFPYSVWWEKLESIHLWVGHKGSYYRCLRARITNLEYSTKEDHDLAQCPLEQIWGYPHIIEYHHPFYFNRMYVIEKQFDTEKDLIYDLVQYDGGIELKGWLDDLFGDG